MSHAPERRKGLTDRRKVEPLVVLCAALCILCTVVTVVFVAPSVISNKNRTDSIQEGRRASQEVFCATASAIIDAGRKTITGAVPPETAPVTKFERELERLGYQPREQRRTDAELAAAAYGRGIAQAVEAQANVKGVVKENGTLDCQQLAKATGTSGTPKPTPTP